MPTYAALQATRLRCEALENPLGLDEPTPRFSWHVTGDGRNRKQSAWRIVVGSSEQSVRQGTGDCWDSGIVKDDETLHRVYQGKTLEPRKRYWWSVQVWDETEQQSTFVAPAHWETGWLSDSWPANWIGYPPPWIPDGLQPPQDTPYDNEWQSLPVTQLRTRFDAKGAVKQARLYATALGVYQARLNGARVGTDEFAPGWTDYHQRVEYQTYDVTHLVQPGSNMLGAYLGEGWYSGYVGFLRKRGGQIWGFAPQFSAVLELEYANGSHERITTGPDWMVSAGGMVYSEFLLGERFDARLAKPNWDTINSDDMGWSPAGYGMGTGGKLQGAMAPAIKVTQELPALSVEQATDGSWVFDLGQNMVGRSKVRFSGLQAGQVIKIRHAEALNRDGTLYIDNLRFARQEDVYVAASDQEVTYEPLFTFHGFRYVAIHGLDTKPRLSDVVGTVIHNEMEVTGRFESSNPLLNKLHANIVWGQRGNFIAVPTDCPQRDERLGWTADAQVFARTAGYNMDIATFFAKFARDIRDTQQPNGAYSDVVPRPVVPMDGAPGWADAGILLPYELFLLYGDRKVLEDGYEGMKAWMAFIARDNPNGLRAHNLNMNYGDWLAVDAVTPKALLATAYYARLARSMVHIARVLGRQDDVARFMQLRETIKAAFIQEFVGQDGKVAGETQTGYLLAISEELLPHGSEAACVQNLVANIESVGHLTTGFHGVRLLCPTLTAYGHSELAYRLATSTSYPSWGYSIAHGATTIWERWDGWTEHAGFQSAAMNSFNHYSLGSIGEWLFRDMAGIDDDASGDAFKRIWLKPTPGPDADWCRASYQSPRGLIAAHWRSDGGGLTFECDIPPNTSARIELPTVGNAKVELDGKEIVVQRYSAHRGEVCRIDVGSGHYLFRVHPH